MAAVLSECHVSQHTPRGVLFFIGVMLLVGGLGGSGCGTKGAVTQPWERLADRDLDPSHRYRMLERVAVGQEDERTILAMWRVVWSDRQALNLRILCMDRLIARDPETFWASAATHLVTVTSTEMLAAIGGRISRDSRTDMIGPLIRSLARPSAAVLDTDRPEARALSELTGSEPINPVMWAVLSGDSISTLAEQAAAWVILCRLDGVDQATAGLVTDPASHEAAGLAALLKEQSAVLRPLPHTREGLLWLLSLRESQGASLGLDEARREVISDSGLVALRHLAAIRRSTPQTLRRSTTAMRTDLAARLAGRPVYPRGLDDEDAIHVPSIPERFADHADAMGWGDLLVLHMILDAMDEPGIVAAMFEQADSDLLDTTAEYGGALNWSPDGKLTASAFAPAMRVNDHTYISPHSLFEAMYTALAHYHFHAQRHDNAAYAGPGGGDLAFADRTGFSCLVLTFIDANTLGVDYYQPGGIVIDLGVIRRP